MAVLGEQLYVSDGGNYPHASVHIFSLQGEHRRTVNLDDVWSINDLPQQLTGGSLRRSVSIQKMSRTRR